MPATSQQGAFTPAVPHAANGNAALAHKGGGAHVQEAGGMGGTGGTGGTGPGGGGHAQGKAFDFGSLGSMGAAAPHAGPEGADGIGSRQVAGSNAAVRDGEGAQAGGKGGRGGFWPAQTLKRCARLVC
jgi:hypothetical protein